MVEVDATPAYVRDSATNVLPRYGSVWSDVKAVARVVDFDPDNRRDPQAPAWLVAVEAESLEPGVYVRSGLGSRWLAGTLIQTFSGGGVVAEERMHCLERIEVSSEPWHWG